MYQTYAASTFSVGFGKFKDLTYERSKKSPNRAIIVPADMFFDRISTRITQLSANQSGGNTASENGRSNYYGQLADGSKCSDVKEQVPCVSCRN